MSYCRWSCDGFRSDIYAYEDVHGGWTIHVAGRKRTTFPEDMPPFPEGAPIEEVKAWADRYKLYLDELEKHEPVPIGLPHDGESFHETSLEAFRDRLLELRKMGYHVPNHALERIEEEIAEQKN